MQVTGEVGRPRIRTLITQGLLAALLTFALAGCGGRAVSLSSASQGEILARQMESVVRGGGLSPTSRNVVTWLGGDLDEPLASIDGLADFVQGLSPEDASADVMRIALAELLILKADRISRDSGEGTEASDELPGLYLFAARQVHDVLRRASTSGALLWDGRSRLAADLYNAAVGGFTAGFADRLVSGQRDFYVAPPFGDPVAVSVEVDRDDVWDPSLFQRFLRADRMDVEGLRDRYLVVGLGAAMVGQRDPTEELLSRLPHVPPEVISYPATAVLEFDESNESLAEIRFFNNFVAGDPRVWGVPVRLSVDTTAAMAGLFSATNIDSLGRRAMLTPEVLAERTKVYRLEPYSDEKIPLLFVHGLRSSPLTWRDAVNVLRSDPEIRRRYQIWQFAYPTGLPIPRSSWLLRENLREIKDAMDPEGDAPWRGKMVVVGHSMGGVLSRNLVTDVDERLWYSAHTAPFDEFEFDADIKEHLREVFFYEPDPDVARVVLVAAPLRGSDMAESWFASIGRTLTVNSPILRRIASAYRNENRDRVNPYLLESTDGVLTGVGSLRPDNPLIRGYMDSPIRKNVTLHVIMGDQGGDSDGVVPHWSSRLDEAVSEVIVPSGHNAHAHPLGIAEIWRIVREHLSELTYHPRPRAQHIESGRD